MKYFVREGLGRLVIVSLKAGDKLLESIVELLEKENIKNAIVLSAIGSLSKVVYHRVATTDANPQDEFLTVEAPIELGSLQGLVANGQPHFHIVFSDLEKTYAGHLEPGTMVLYLAEIVLCEIPGNDFQRIKNEFNIALLTEIE